MGCEDRVACVQVTAAWSSSAPDVEPPDFARQVWPGIRIGKFAVSRVVVRHGAKADKNYWRSFDGILDLGRAWSAVDWTEQIPEALRTRIKESTGGHLTTFFRQSLEGASRVRACWGRWPLEVSDDLSLVSLPPADQLVISDIVASEAKGDLLLTFWGERETALWLGEQALLARLAGATWPSSSSP